MRTMIPMFLTMLLIATGCIGRGSGRENTILVDYGDDAINTAWLKNFPERVKVRPGTMLVFRQTWTGEPHTVTGGTLVDEKLVNAPALTDFFDAFDTLTASGAPLPNPEDPGDATVADFAEALEGDDGDAMRRAYNALRDADVPLPPLDSDTPFADVAEVIEKESAVLESLPFAAVGESLAFEFNQNAAQPCYLKRGGPPEDPAEPCSEDDQQQPEFDGSYSYFNSGIIPYEGPLGNTFRVPLADDLNPGTYTFYCAVHGPGQLTEVEVVSATEDAQTQEEITLEARRTIREGMTPLRSFYDGAVKDGTIEYFGERLEGPFAGLWAPAAPAGLINEFVPDELEVEAGEALTWKMIGPHTITFGAPRYFPPGQFLADGTVRVNPKLNPPAGGALEPGEPEGDIWTIDGGTYDGEGFWSSGMLVSDPSPYLLYTMRVSKPGRYRFACLFHPPMVGTLVVT